jgi:hypothetical protein
MKVCIVHSTLQFKCSLLVGMEKLQKSMTLYVKSISRKEAEDREKMLPIEFLGQTMISHGQDFQADSEFGNCLVGGCNRKIQLHSGSHSYRHGTRKRVAGPQTRELCCQRNLMLVGISRKIARANEGVPGNIDYH